MPQAIMVKKTNGYYEIHTAAPDEDWDTVQALSTSTERVESLTGWGMYTGVYRVTVMQSDLYYFVAEED